jgi:thiol-disulfide isomerase/thioredoxin
VKNLPAYILAVVAIGLGGSYFYTKFKVAPDLEFEQIALTDANGSQVTLPRSGKKKIVCFWATWCGPCREELRLLAAQKQSLSDVDIFLVSDEPSEKVQDFIARSGYDFNFLYSPVPLSKIGVYSIPTSYFLNDAGEIKKKHTGFIDWSDPSTFEHYRKVMESQQ